ncbi:MAG TPA: GNAT family N-acetyltransferase [Hyphomonadaceae bacterium]|nr:GNAT family N-acetyltransferase [Hyphomonadaceae bacterium]
MIHIRTARRTDAAGISRVHERTWKEAYKGLLDGSYLEALSERRLVPRWRSNLDRRSEDLDDAIYVAVSGKEIVGFVTVGATREAFAPWEAEISMVYVLKEQRGAGIGRALMKTAADHCIRRAMFSGGLWVLRDNGAARDFYEALKGEHAGRKVDSVGGQIVPLVGYWWRDLATLAERSVSPTSIGPG